MRSVSWRKKNNTGSCGPFHATLASNNDQTICGLLVPYERTCADYVVKDVKSEDDPNFCPKCRREWRRAQVRQSIWNLLCELHQMDLPASFTFEPYGTPVVAGQYRVVLTWKNPSLESVNGPMLHEGMRASDCEPLGSPVVESFVVDLVQRRVHHRAKVKSEVREQLEEFIDHIAPDAIAAMRNVPGRGGRESAQGLAEMAADLFEGRLERNLNELQRHVAAGRALATPLCVQIQEDVLASWRRGEHRTLVYKLARQYI